MSKLGFRFNPTDEELVNHFLKHKIDGNELLVENIAHIQLFNFAPWDLPALSKMKDNKEWFFFTCLEKINKTSLRYSRKTKYGSWKKTGKNRKIKAKGTTTIIGLKRTLVFKKYDHEKTEWIIHEYHANEAIFPHNKTNLVLCRLMNKDEQVTHSSSHISAADFEKQPMMVLSQNIGYRFHPTEEELVGHYLKHKLFGNDSIVSNITEVNLNSIEPWEIPVMLALSKTTSDDSEWYFFTTDDLKYKKSTRCIRTTNAGYWKKTGKTREIKIKGANNVIGSKKILVFYKHCGSHFEKTNWIIHQYHAINVPDSKRNFVLCRLMQKTEVLRDEFMNDEGASNHVAACIELESIATPDLTRNVCGSPEVTMEYNLLASPHEDDYSFREYSFSAAIDQTPYFEGLTSSNAHFKTENSNAGFPFETVEEDNADYNSFLNSDLAAGDVYISYETSQNAPTFVNDSTA